MSEVFSFAPSKLFISLYPFTHYIVSSSFRVELGVLYHGFRLWILVLDYSKARAGFEGGKGVLYSLFNLIFWKPELLC